MVIFDLLKGLASRESGAWSHTVGHNAFCVVCVVLYTKEPVQSYNLIMSFPLPPPTPP